MFRLQRETTCFTYPIPPSFSNVSCET
jgi:hypothetical protein